MAAFVLLSIVTVHLVFLCAALFTQLAAQRLKCYSANLRYRLWKLLFLVVPICLVMIFCKTALYTARIAQPLFTVTLSSETGVQTAPISPGLAENGLSVSAPLPNSRQAFMDNLPKMAPIINCFYLFGGGLWLAYVFLRHRLAGRGLANRCIEAPHSLLEIRDKLCADLAVRKIPIAMTDAIATPMLAGGFRAPIILLPADEHSPENWRCILKHELLHFKRGDLGWKLISTILVCFLWCNPLVYLAKKQMDNICELACDEAVVNNVTPCERREYAAALIDCIASTGRKANNTSLFFSSEGGYKQMYTRIQNIIKERATKKGRGIILVCGAVLFGFLGAGACFHIEESAQTLQPFLLVPAQAEPVQAPPAPAENDAPPVQTFDYASPLPGVSPTQDENQTFNMYAVSPGTPVLSAGNGVVVEAKTKYESLGKYVTVENANGERFYYANLESFSVGVFDIVSVGDVLGLSGSTGNAPKSGQLAFYAKDKAGEYITAEINYLF